MSRLLVFSNLLLLFGTSTAYAQVGEGDDIPAMIDKQRRTIALDGDGCPKYPEKDVIVVCGKPQEEKDRKLFQGAPPADRIRPGEAISTTRAAQRDLKACANVGSGMGCIQLDPLIRSRFGSVPEPAIPLEQVLNGLAPQDLVDSAKENVDD